MMRKLPGMKLLLTAALLVLATGLFAPAAMAAPNPTCTTDPSFNIQNAGLISGLVSGMQSVLGAVSSEMYNGIITDTAFIAAVSAAITLYIAIYGIMFTFGMVHITIFDFAIRMVKIAIIAALIIPATSWQFFGNTVVDFFNVGTDEVINAVTSIGVGGVLNPESPDCPYFSTGPLAGQPNPSPTCSAPFVVLDGAISQAVSAKMAVTLWGVVTTPPYGPIIGLLLFMALGSFLKSLLNAMWVYLMSLVLKALLFGTAPIFLSCLLFSRTRHIFDGWLNQLVNASLQPILLFTFYSFFAVLISTTIGDILSNPFCYTESDVTLQGSGTTLYKWGAEIWDSTAGGYMPYNGQWTFAGAQGSAKIFPVDIMTVLTLLILAELAGRFNNVVVMIAMDLSGTLTNLSGMQGAFSEMMGGMGGGKGSARGVPPIPLKQVGGVLAGDPGGPGIRRSGPASAPTGSPFAPGAGNRTIV